MSSSVERLDVLVRDFLVFRGFAATLRAYEAELRGDRDRGLRAERLLEQLQLCVSSLDLQSLRDLWAHLEKRLFSRLEHAHMLTTCKLRTGVLRAYVAHSVQAGRPDKTLEFFQRVGPELHGSPEWREWFALPFLPSPETHSTFSAYFTKQWNDTLWLSLHNFLSVLLHTMPVPSLLCFDSEVQRSNILQEENEALRFKLYGQVEAQKPRKLADVPFVRAGEADVAVTAEQKSRQASGSAQKSSSVKKQTTPLRKDAAVCESGRSGGVRDGRQTERARRNGQSERESRQQLLKASALSVEKRPDSEQSATDSPSKAEAQSKASATTAATTAAASGGARINREEASQQPFLVLCQEEYSEHHSPIMHCKFDASGSRVASVDVDGVVKVWSCSPTPQTHTTVMAKSPLLSLEWATKPHRLLLLGSGIGSVRFYDTDQKKSVADVTLDMAYPRVLALACSPTGGSFVCGAAASAHGNGTSPPEAAGGSATRGQLSLWDAKTLRQQHLFTLDPEPVAITCVSFNHNGNLLVCGATDGLIRLYDVQRYDCLMSWRAHQGEVCSVEFSGDETGVFSMGADGKFTQWHLQREGARVAELEVHADAAGPFEVCGCSGYKQTHAPRGRLFAFEPSSGQHVLTCSAHGGIVYRLESGSLSPCLTLGGHRAPVVTVEWTTAMDCGMCLTASMDGKIRVSTLLAQ
ncbi:WD repeat-containing protein 91 [Lethenteron reissneri]|uniref:WD repeat-containing protein 91 n=1 Tax=Lethenteron reissneri TaxID=7753 RepID=UPI002AB64227|nr:WD repeat-containing protein 91 [Lethenteron reissneri]